MSRLLTLAKQNAEKKGECSHIGEGVQRIHPAFAGQRVHSGKINHLTNQTDMIHFHDPLDIIKFDRRHGNALNETLTVGSARNPSAVNGKAIVFYE